MAILTLLEREKLSREFWDSVRRKLIEEYRRPGEIADRNIEMYRNELHLREIGDLVYNQGIEKTAEVVNGIIDHGLNKPGAA